MDLTIIIPFYNGHKTIKYLVNSLPADFPIIIIDDVSDVPLKKLELLQPKTLRIIRAKTKAYFSGAVNLGIQRCDTDVLVINQDVVFKSYNFFKLLNDNYKHYAMIGERIAGTHPAWPRGYIHGTLMYMSREAIQNVGLLNETDYPLWGSTCEWQLRAARKGYKVLSIRNPAGFKHLRKGLGSSIKSILKKESDKKDLFIRTPPAVSVVVSCYNYGRYLPDLVNSFLGGTTSIGKLSAQTFQSFEIVLVDDCSTDDSFEIAQSLADPWKGIHAIQTPKNGGTPVANNIGVEFAHGKYIAIMNGDDMRSSESLERLYRAQLANPHSFIYDDVMLFGKNGIHKKAWRMPEFDFDALIYKNQIHAGIMFPKTAWIEVDGYPEVMRHGREDWAFNIALGLSGYCGVHVKHPGYLYRREGQNRTLKNTTPRWHEQFSRAIQNLFPLAYTGVRPMDCCGGGRSVNISKRSNHPKARKQAQITGSSGMTILEYLGGNHGTVAFFGPFTGVPYKFNVKSNKRNVDNRDLETDAGTGLLQLFENKRQVFQVAQLKPGKPSEDALVAHVTEHADEKATEDVATEVALMQIPLDDLTVVKGIGKSTARVLNDAGYASVQSVAKIASEEILAEQVGWTEEKAAKIIESAQRTIAKFA